MSVVTKRFIMLNIYAGIEMAVGAFHENGDASESIAQLESLLAALEDYNQEVQDTDIDFDMRLVQQLIDVMVENDIQPPVVIYPARSVATRLSGSAKPQSTRVYESR